MMYNDCKRFTRLSLPYLNDVEERNIRVAEDRPGKNWESRRPVGDQTRVRESFKIKTRTIFLNNVNIVL